MENFNSFNSWFSKVSKNKRMVFFSFVQLVSLFFFYFVVWMQWQWHYKCRVDPQQQKQGRSQTNGNEQAKFKRQEQRQTSQRITGKSGPKVTKRTNDAGGGTGHLSKRVGCFLANPKTYGSWHFFNISHSHHCLNGI